MNSDHPPLRSAVLQDVLNDTKQGRSKIVDRIFTEVIDLSALDSLDTLQFKNCRFAYGLRAVGVEFRGAVVFECCKFDHDVLFDESTFHRQLAINDCEINSDLFVRRATFMYDFHLTRSMIRGAANLRDSSFSGYADLSNSTFSTRIKLLNCHFSDEIRLANARLNYLKATDPVGIDFSSSTLSSPKFWQSYKIENCSFRDCLLLAVSFDRLSIVNCDFTGAVFDSVVLQADSLDQATIENTKFIYLRWSGDSVDPDKWAPIAESRVPIEGHFGEGAYKAFTLREAISRAVFWKKSFVLPRSIRSAVVGYFQFFSEYIDAISGVPIDVTIERTGDSISIGFQADGGENLNLLLSEVVPYVQNVVAPTERIRAVVASRSKLSDSERELFQLRYEYEITTLKSQIKYSELLLRKEEEKNLQLLTFIDLLKARPEQALLSTSPVGTQQLTNNISINALAESRSASYSELLSPLLSEVEQFATTSNLDAQQTEELRRLLLNAREELIRSQPRPSVIKSTLMSIKTILEGAAGTVLASSLLKRIVEVLSG